MKDIEGEGSTDVRSGLRLLRTPCSVPLSIVFGSGQGIVHGLVTVVVVRGTGLPRRVLRSVPRHEV